MPAHTKKEQLKRQLSAMKTERESFDNHYQELARFVSPRRGRFFKDDRNKGGRHFWNDIINGQASWALKNAVAGIFNGIMSPSRPWLMLETDDPGVVEFGPAKTWFHQVQEEMLRIFNDSNLYGMAPMMIREQLLFGTGCMSHEDDLQKLARFFTHTVGSYWLAQNDRFEVDTVAREFERTVLQIITQFSRSRRDINPSISVAVRNAYDRGDYHLWFPVVQHVEPNIDFVPGSRRPKERAFGSWYYEPGNTDADAFLSVRGFDEFPFYCPRWELTNEDIYGTDCPGMMALGDVRQLQSEEKRKAQGLAKMVSPPLHGPAALKNQAVSSLPSGGTFYDAPGTQNTLRAIYEVKLPIGELVLDMERVEGRINRAFFVDLFLAISTMEGVQPRNQLELFQRNQERLQLLGPTLERQFGEFLDPLISRTFNQMLRAGLVPPPPDVLQNRPLKPRYVSTLAMAQQAVSTGNIDRLVGFVGNLTSIGLSDGKKFDGDQAVDEYASLIGAPPRLIVPDDVVAKQREREQQQQQQAINLEMGERAANIGKLASETELSDDNVAGQVAQRLGVQTKESEN